MIINPIFFCSKIILSFSKNLIKAEGLSTKMGKRVILGLTAEITLFSSDGQEIKVIGRIDTGATASSIDSNLAKQLCLGPIIKTKLIKSASGNLKRPIVKSKLKLNGDIIEADFSLADRSHMTYPVLVGQNILKKGHFLIDPKK